MINKKFRNEILVPKFNLEINHNRSLISFGSCFSKHIHNYFKFCGFGASYYYGTIYNPISIAKNLKKVLEKTEFKIDDLVQLNGVYLSWNHSGKIFSSNKEKLLKTINENQKEILKNLNKKPVVVLTFGSAYVYSLKSNGNIVANCHKKPNTLFNKRKLSIEQIVKEWTEIINEVDADFIFTVSPVRHFRDGFIENNRSKSVLILAVEQVCNLFPNKAHYFPSYEIMIDELRDYRFYANDWVHPSNEAVDFICQKFGDSFFKNDTPEIISQIIKIRNNLAHRPIYGITNNHLEFLNKTLQYISKLKEKTPLYDWSIEEKKINEQLIQ